MEFELCVLCAFGNEDCTCGAYSDENISYAGKEDYCEHLNTGVDYEGFFICEDCGVELP